MITKHRQNTRNTFGARRRSFRSLQRRLGMAMLVGVLSVVFTVGSPAVNSSGVDFELSRITIDGGGVVHGIAGNFELSGTIAQPDAGVMVGGSFELTGGFWFGIESGDCDVDGGVSRHDLVPLTDCLNGPDVGLLMMNCACFDSDSDEDDDLRDFARFQLVFTGP